MNAELDRIARASGALAVMRAPEGFDALVAADATRRRGGRAMFVAQDAQRAVATLEAARFFAPDLRIVSLPAWDCQPYDRVGPSAGLAAERTAALAALAVADDGPTLVITTVAAVLQRSAPREALAAATFRAHAGGVAPMETLKAYLSRNGYLRAGSVTEPGEYALRGGVADVFPPDRPEPLRFDYFGDTLESLRTFAPDTQRTTGALDAAVLHPVSEAPLDEDAIARFRRGYVAAFGGDTGADPIYQGVSQGVRAPGSEHFLSLFHERLETVFDLLGADGMVFLDHMADAAAAERLALIADYHQARAEAPDAQGAGAFAAASGRALPPDALYLTKAEWAAGLTAAATRRFSPFDEADADAVDLGVRPGRDFGPERKGEGVNVFDAAASHVKALQKARKRVVLACWSQGSAERTGAVLADHGAEPMAGAATWSEALALPEGTVARTALALEHGFETPDVAVIAEQDILGDRLSRPRRKRRAANFIAEASALAPGDLVVHVDHGIGRYLGLKTLEVVEARHDCLEIEYAGASKLLLPVENIEMLSRYGAAETGVQLDKLGGANWQARKAKAKKRLRDMAADLVKVAAARATREGETLEAAAGLYEEFAARFPYAETDDQLSAIEDVLGDLSSGRPMDRLICGDVGFGKTEVALRAAFAAAMNGKQVALICPTTLLARQHYAAIKTRFQGLPVKVRQLSRLVSAKDATATRKALAEGRVDIIVGTHALLAKTVTFQDLGLLIIDEEQHFGVRHKERLKELKADVHVLTLTATPIPRTLQMSLAGLRDLSIIATPPVDRLAVRTYVTPFDPVTLREALLRERFRGGRSFFVVPRIKDLPDAEEFLSQRVPELSVVTANGRMAAGDLEDRIGAFYEGRYDVLLSTPIVESGLDIPSANTMVIHRADMFGLAQLYQLRGRVGRSKTRAYAYMTTPADWKITPAAEKRLKVLQSLDHLGAGFTLASHDLDLRGGGNLLGEEQSGHIKDVGVELFQAMLEEAIADQKGEELAGGGQDWSPQINVGASILIPEDYVPDLDLRLALYRRLSNLDTTEAREGFAAELIDRFGALPDEVKHLIDVLEIKAACRRCAIAKLDAGPKGAVAHFRAEALSNPAGLFALVAQRPGEYKLRPDETLLMRGDWPTADSRVRGLRKAMAKLADALEADAPVPA